MGPEIKMESHVQRPSGHKGYDMEEELEELKGDLGSCRGVTGRATSHVAWKAIRVPFFNPNSGQPLKGGASKD